MLDYMPSTIAIDVEKYLTKDTNPPFVNATFYRRLVGQLMFATNSRFDVCFVVDNSHRL